MSDMDFNIVHFCKEMLLLYERKSKNGTNHFAPSDEGAIWW